MATPPTAGRTSVPESVAPPGFAAKVIVTSPVNAGVGLPNASCAATTTAGAIVVFTGVAVGWTVNARSAGAPGVMSNAADVASVSAPDDATSVYPTAAVSMKRSLKVATPSTALTAVVPLSVPPPGFAPRASETSPVNAGSTAPVPSRASTMIGPRNTPAPVVAGDAANASWVAVAPVAVAVKVSGLPVRPATVAVIVCAPTPGPRVHVVLAWPLASVTMSVEVGEPPFAAANVTVTPATPSPSAAVTRAVTGRARIAPAGPVCPFPPWMAMVVGDGVTVTVEVSAAPPRSEAITSVVPRAPLFVAVPTRSSANERRVGSVLLK